MGGGLGGGLGRGLGRGGMGGGLGGGLGRGGVGGGLGRGGGGRELHGMWWGWEGIGRDREEYRMDWGCGGKWTYKRQLQWRFCLVQNHLMTQMCCELCLNQSLPYSRVIRRPRLYLHKKQMGA